MENNPQPAGMDPDELRHIQQTLGFTDTELALAIGWAGTSAQTLRKMKRGKKAIGTHTAEKLRALMPPGYRAP